MHILEHEFIQACKYGNILKVKILLKRYDINPNINNNWPIRCTSLKGHIELVKLLLHDSRIDPSVLDNTSIRGASNRGHTEIVKLLLQHPKVDPTADNNYALEFAAYNGRYEVIKLLLNDPRVDIDKKFIMYIMKAMCFDYHRDNVIKLLKDGMMIKIFHKLNRVVCLERIKKFLLKKVVLRPNSIYVKRLINEF
jgi:ankyrin repeat protein